MDNPKNLDDYLAGLGISEADDDAPPPLLDPAASPVPLVAGEPDADPAALLDGFLKGLVGRIDPELQVNVSQDGMVVQAEIQGERASRLAGRDGRTLGAIEVLCYAVLSRQGHSELRVRVDAGGFRHRHAENLTRLAERLAVQVAKSGESHEMQPMPPSDRRVIHLALQEHPMVSTESVGEGSARRLIIRPRTDLVGG
ncbi:protein jag [Deinococcus sonorensis]|uniref:Protein jag n=2 Tax=Deinococcus sonorensis TaxID=309891 RepID=A0AAU7UF19_9DEIO